jgi:uncharacterized membrane protein
MERKGVPWERHYYSLGPQNSILPLLHLQMGMINQAFVSFEAWVDDCVAVIPLAEKETQKEVEDAICNHNLALKGKRESEATINIALQEKNVTVNVIKAQLQRKKKRIR